MTQSVKTLLHVDDDADDREMLAATLQKVAPGLKVMGAENGLQALDLLYQQQKTKTLPDLIVLDLNMPYLNGIQTFERIKADPQLSAIPLVIFSTSESPADKALFSKGGIPFFTKPVDFSAMGRIASQMANLCA